MDQSKGLVVDPLEVVDGDQEWPMRRERSMCCLEDAKGRMSHLIAAAERELSEAVAMDGHGRQVADDLAGSGQRDGLIGLEADDADEWRGVRPGQDLREQPGL